MWGGPGGVGLQWPDRAGLWAGVELGMRMPTMFEGDLDVLSTLKEHNSDMSMRGMEKHDGHATPWVLESNTELTIYWFSCVLILKDYLSIYKRFDSKYLHAKILETDTPMIYVI
jgi:hypothetical protein